MICNQHVCGRVLYEDILNDAALVKNSILKYCIMLCTASIQIDVYNIHTANCRYNDINVKIATSTTASWPLAAQSTTASST